jgi:hypothetical protein
MNLSLGPGLRSHRSREGLSIVADIPSQNFRGSFPVRRSGADAVGVGYGRCNNVVPVIDHVPIDGLVAGIQKSVPTLSLREGPNKALESWIMLQVSVDPKTGLVDPKNPDAYTIIHSNERIKRSNGLILDDGKGNGRFELALILWNEDQTVKRIVQNPFSDLGHHFRDGVHFFKGVP